MDLRTERHLTQKVLDIIISGGLDDFALPRPGRRKAQAQCGQTAGHTNRGQDVDAFPRLLLQLFNVHLDLGHQFGAQGHADLDVHVQGTRRYHLWDPQFGQLLKTQSNVSVDDLEKHEHVPFRAQGLRLLCCPKTHRVDAVIQSVENRNLLHNRQFVGNGSARVAAVGQLHQRFEDVSPQKAASGRGRVAFGPR